MTDTYTPYTIRATWHYGSDYRVSDAHSREEYGTVAGLGGTWHANSPVGGFDRRLYLTREEAAHALYRTCTAFGFEAGVL